MDELVTSGGIAGFLIGSLFGAVIGASVRPIAARVERLARRLFHENPLIVHVERDQSIIWAGDPPWVGFSYFFRDTFPHEMPPSVCADWSGWAARFGGVDVSLSMLEVTLQAKADVAVVIENVKVRNEKLSIPNGVIGTCPVGGADLSPRRFTVNLDSFNPPDVYFTDGDGESVAPPKMVLAAGDIERFHIWVSAETGWNEWFLELPLLVEGRRRVVKVADGGAPFVTVGNSDGFVRSAWIYDGDGWAEH